MTRIAPSGRLLWSFALVVLPASAAPAFWPAVAPAAAALLLLYALAMAVDAWLAPRRLDGLSPVAPPLLRATRDRASALALTLRKPAGWAGALVAGLPFQEDLGAAADELRLALPAGAEAVRLEWRLTPRRRGDFRLDHLYLEAPSRTGCWLARRRLDCTVDVRVYPNLLRERRSMALLRRGRAGVQLLRQVGKGREFEKLREYAPGDGFDEIHWKATARRGRPITKVFQVERTQEVYVVIDASRLAARQVEGEALIERYLSAGLLFVRACEEQGDLFGFLTFTDKVDRFVRARNGRQHYVACREALYSLEARRVTPDFSELANFLRQRLRRRALIVLLTELDDPLLAEQFERNMELVCRQHLILANMPQPAGVAPLFSSAEPHTIDDIYQQFGGHLRWRQLQQLRRRLEQKGVTLSLVDAGQITADLTRIYRNVKQRQLL